MEGIVVKELLEEIKRSGLFDEVYYLARYPDVKRAGVDPIRHYLEKGAKEGRNPSREFDTAYYVKNNPDIASSSFNPLVHFIRHGKQEGRLPRQPLTIKVSVILTAYNVRAYVETCLDSLLAQRLEEIEIIVVDDGSKDGTSLILADYASRFISGLTVLCQPHAGTVRACERGIKHSRGTYCLLMDADDWLEPDALEKLYGKAVENDYDYINYGYFDHDFSGHPFPCSISSMTQIGSGLMESMGCFSLWSKLIKREYLLRLDWAQIPSLSYEADVIPAFWLEALKPKKAFLDECLYHYRRHPKRADSQLGKSSVDAIFIVAAGLEKTARAFQISEREQPGISAYVKEQLMRYESLQVSDAVAYFQKKWASSHYSKSPPAAASRDSFNGYAVSIIITVYNREDCIARCLDSALSQTLKDVQVIVVDDGSTDKTGEIIESYASKHPNLTRIFQPNQGALRARNRAIKEVAGAYVLMVDSDDYLPVHALETCWKAALSYDLDMVTFNHRRIDTIRNQVKSHYNTSSLGAKFVKAELYRQIDYDDLPSIVICEDDLVTWLLKLVPHTCAHLNEDLYCRIIHRNSIMQTKMGRWIQDSITLYEYLTKEIQKQGLPFSRQEDLHRWLCNSAKGRLMMYPEAAKELLAYLESVKPMATF